MGIAEAAHANVVSTLRRRVESVLADPHAITELSANVVELTAMRASFDRAGRLIDEHFAALVRKDPDFYGILRPRPGEAAALGVKSVDRETALLFLTLREPGPLPRAKPDPVRTAGRR